jgi:hypothetical protein
MENANTNVIIKEFNECTINSKNSGFCLLVVERSVSVANVHCECEGYIHDEHKQMEI